jgi:hypothetical protein
MQPGSTITSGQCTSGPPDVCNTPSSSGTTPVSYTNTSQLSNCTNTSSKVFFDNGQVVHLNSSMSSSSGDEAGSSGGTVSGVNMSKVAYSQGSSKVTIEGNACIYNTCATLHNGSSSNTTGTQTSASQQKVQVGE